MDLTVDHLSINLSIEPIAVNPLLAKVVQVRVCYLNVVTLS